MRSGLVPLALLSLLVTACHWVFGYSPAPTARDGGDHRAGRDRPNDRVALDRSDAARGDGRDGRMPDRKVAVDTLCAFEDSPIANPSCLLKCTPTSSDADCDALPDGRDPFSLCNPVVWSDSFAYPPGTWPKSWGRAYCDPALEHMTCGRLRFAFAKNQTQDAWTAPAVLLQPTDLVEVHILPSSKRWDFGLVIATTTLDPAECYSWTGWHPGASRQCKIALQANYVTLYSDVSGGLLGSSYAPLSNLPPQGLVLQSFVKGTSHYCRLFNGTAPITQAVATNLTVTLPDAQTVLLEVVNNSGVSSFDVDWVRVFR